MASELETDITAMFYRQMADPLHALYRHTKNAIHVWSAYRLARTWRMPIPDWVLDYLDACAVAVTTTPTSAKTMADAIGLGTRLGSGVTRQAATDRRHLEMVERIIQLRQRPSRRDLETLKRRYHVTEQIVDPGDRTLLDILTQVADEFGLSLDRTTAIYYTLTR